MLGSFKGISACLCLFLLLTAAAVSAQEAGVVSDPGDAIKGMEGDRSRNSIDIPRPKGEVPANALAYHAVADATAKKIFKAVHEVDDDAKPQVPATGEPSDDGGLTRYSPMWDEEDLRRNFTEVARFQSPVEKASGPDPADEEDDPVAAPPLDRFHWKPAIYQSLIAQGFQHSYALIFQEKTQRALKGPFFKDYWESVKGVRGWTDGNRFFTNYIAHPMQGSMTGFIYLQNHDRLKRQMFNESAQYWKDRAKALLWSTAWSTNWEIGPISQSTIGNVGLYGKQGYVDLVITPTVGTAWMITEEALDRYIIRHAEGSLAARIFLRTVLNPTRSVANMLRFKKPWYRDRAR